MQTGYLSEYSFQSKQFLFYLSPLGIHGVERSAFLATSSPFSSFSFYLSLYTCLCLILLCVYVLPPSYSRNLHLDFDFDFFDNDVRL